MAHRLKQRARSKPSVAKAHGAGIPPVVVQPAAESLNVAMLAKSFAPAARALAKWTCEGCAHRTPKGSQVLLALPIIDQAHAGAWPDFYTAGINGLALCHACARSRTTPNDAISMKLGRARRAFEAWRTFDRIPDDKQYPGCDR